MSLWIRLCNHTYIHTYIHTRQETPTSMYVCVCELERSYHIQEQVMLEEVVPGLIRIRCRKISPERECCLWLVYEARDSWVLLDWCFPLLSH